MLSLNTIFRFILLLLSIIGLNAQEGSSEISLQNVITDRKKYDEYIINRSVGLHEITGFKQNDSTINGTGNVCEIKCVSVNSGYYGTYYGESAKKKQMQRMEDKIRKQMEYNALSPSEKKAIEAEKKRKRKASAKKAAETRKKNKQAQFNALRGQ